MEMTQPIEKHADAILRSAGEASTKQFAPKKRQAILDATQAAYDDGWQAGWAAFGALMLEQMPEPARTLAREIMEKELPHDQEG